MGPGRISSGARRWRFRPRALRLEGARAALEPAEALSRLRDRRRPVLLDSAAGAPRRFSLLAFDPLPPDLPGSSDPPRPPRSIRELGDWVGRLVPEPGDDFPKWFRGGFLGALSYDLGVAGEDLALPGEPWGFPLVVGGLYTDFLVRDEERGESWLVLGDEPGDGRPPVEARRSEILAALARPHPRATSPHPLGDLERCVTRALHRARIERAREAIAAGEIYQANLAHRFVRKTAGDPVDLYLRLRRLHPGPYLGFLRFEGGAVLSGSPELLLEFDPAARVARTRPIKGTIERARDPEEDRRRAAELLASEKDLAELAMIVDLERNDLGRVARVGGVRVGDFPRLESYATVHHLVADVEADVAPGVGGADVLASLFPGGSITGAPKLRSMEIIAELEGEGRGFAYGSLAMIDTAGRVNANILIRTLLWRPLPGVPDGGEVSFRVGGGITWASDAAREDEESLAKGAALARALEGRKPAPARTVAPDGHP